LKNILATITRKRFAGWYSFAGFGTDAMDYFPAQLLAFMLLILFLGRGLTAFY